MKRKFLQIFLAVLALTVATGVRAQAPAGYYSSLNGKKDAELKTAVYNLVRNFTTVSSYTDLPKYFQRTDVYPESKRWWDMYSNIPLYAPSFSGLNREHSFPKSWWGGLTDVTAYVDLNHLYPSEMAANTAKSNYPLGVVDMAQAVKFNNGACKVGYPVVGQGGGAKSVFEPDNEYKGDFARTYFYMVTCYQTLTWNKSYMWMLQQNTYPTLTSWAIKMLLQWSKDDPVSEKETLRNNAVYSIQNNRNPFIDFPQLAEYIWGDKMGQVFNEATAGTGGIPTLITPVQDMYLDFGQVALGKSVTAKLFFNGENLTEPVSLTVYTGDRTMFTIPTRTIAANLVNSESGYWLPVTYTPTAVGQNTSRLLIQGGGIPGSRGIELRGECLEVPVLSRITATAATEVTDNSYIANWNVPDDVVDYYVVTRTIYGSGSNVTTVEAVAEDNYLQIIDFDPATTESYTVQSVRLGYRSEPSNAITVQTGGVTGIRADAPLAITGIDGAIHFVCAENQTNVRIIDMQGRIINHLPELISNTYLETPAGIYLVVTDQCARPQRVVVK